MNKPAKIFIFVAVFIAVFALSGCARYRYECQEYGNWEKPECNPPICVPDGTCTKDLLKEAP